MGDGDNLSEWFADVLGHELATETLTGSSRRIRRAYAELLSGYESDFQILNVTTRVPAGVLTDVVRIKGMPFFSLCGHHMLPYFGTCSLEYLPREVITGLGKVPRLVDTMARRFIIQEDLTREIAEQIMSQIDPIAVRVVTNAQHLCVLSRGPRATSESVECSYSLGDWR